MSHAFSQRYTNKTCVSKLNQVMFGTNAVYAFKYILKRDNNPQYQQMGIPASGLSNILYNANLPLEQAEKKKKSIWPESLNIKEKKKLSSKAKTL